MFCREIKLHTYKQFQFLLNTSLHVCVPNAANAPRAGKENTSQNSSSLAAVLSPARNTLDFDNSCSYLARPLYNYIIPIKFPRKGYTSFETSVITCPFMANVTQSEP